MTLDADNVPLVAVGVAVLGIFGLAMLLQAVSAITSFFDRRDEKKINPIIDMINKQKEDTEKWMLRFEDALRSTETRLVGRIDGIAAGRPTAVDFERLKGRVASLENLRDLSPDESSFPR